MQRPLASQPSEICGKNGAQKAPAWQYERGTSSCYALGHDAEITPRTFNFKIHDADKPALGFDLQYHSGDSSFCGNNNDVKRSFTISFLCDSNEFDQVCALGPSTALAGALASHF